MFDKKNNSIRQIWKNLNTVCSFKGSNATKPVSKLMSNGIELTNSPLKTYALSLTIISALLGNL